MDDAGRLGGRERIRNLRHQLAHAPPRQLLLRREQRAQAAPAHQLHDEIRAAFGQRAVVDRARHVRMLELRGGHRFAGEARCDLAVARELGAHDLERDLLVQRQVLGHEHRAHPAFAEQAQDPIALVEYAAGPFVWLARVRGGGRFERARGIRTGRSAPGEGRGLAVLRQRLRASLARHAGDRSTICAETGSELQLYALEITGLINGCDTGARGAVGGARRDVRRGARGVRAPRKPDRRARCCLRRRAAALHRIARQQLRPARRVEGDPQRRRRSGLEQQMRGAVEIGLTDEVAVLADWDSGERTRMHGAHHDDRDALGRLAGALQLERIGCSARRRRGVSVRYALGHAVVSVMRWPDAAVQHGVQRARRCQSRRARRRRPRSARLPRRDRRW